MNRIFNLFIVFSLLVTSAANANVVIYVVGRDGNPALPPVDDYEKVKRVYIYGGYNLHFPDDMQILKAESGRGGLSAGLGFRFTDIFRTELAYENLNDKFTYAPNTNPIMSKGHFGFLNFIMDAKLPHEYRFLRTSPFVPFVGFGAGAGLRTLDNGMEFNNKVGFAYNYIAGISIEINRTLAIAFTYKYVKAIPDELMIDSTVTIEKFAPSSHNVSATFRMNF